MDPIKNPYAPGAGTFPAELAGRGDLIVRAAIALDRIRLRRAARSLIFHGLRGAGKTVLLNKIRQDAEGRGFSCVWIEAPEDRSLPAILAPALRATLIRLSAGEAMRAGLKNALSALTGFVAAMKIKYNDIEVTMDHEPQKGVADSGDLEHDLADLFARVGAAALEHGTAVVLFIDELQYVKEDQLSALIAALHRAGHDQLPLTMLAAGLPQLVGKTGRAKSYAERLFEFVHVDSLDADAARDALCIPAEREGVTYDAEAIAAIQDQTKGYPYFLQEWGKHAWNIAEASPIKSEHASRATAVALAELDSSFFRVRFDRLTPAEKRYLRAMAELGPGPHRSGDVAHLLNKKVTTVAPTRNNLISKGMIFSPSHGDTAFTVPLFDGFMKRIMPILQAGAP
jgi:hypothetical protein